MEDFIYFLREKRATLLIAGGSILAFIWFIFMIQYDLFSILPFGHGMSMGWTLAIFVPLAPVLLFGTYWIGSENSIVDGFFHDVACFIYVMFKNCMIILAVITLVIGFPRIKYYQMRASDYPGLSQLGYYQQRTIFNMFRNGVYIVDSSSDHSEYVAPVVVPEVSSSHSSSSSSSSHKSNNDGWGKILGPLIAIILIALTIIYYMAVVGLCFVFADFWLVAIICISVGMISLGFIDIMDGPSI